jgi:hypothetical protein
MADINEVWGWAERIGDQMQRKHRIRELRQAIIDGENQCGGCDKWMTKSCPREVQDNRRGHSVGPSAKSIKCNEFVMKRWDADRIAGLKAELAQLEDTNHGN